MSYNYYNPFANIYPNTQGQDLNALIMQAQQMQQNNPYNPQAQPNNAMNNRGDYVVIKDYKEVETTPARVDGVATLFFDYTNMVFYSKKLSNGKPAIQSFQFAVMNVVGEETQQEETKVDQQVEQPKQDKTEAILQFLQQQDIKIAKLAKEVSTLKKSNKEKAVKDNV